MTIYIHIDTPEVAADINIGFGDETIVLCGAKYIMWEHTIDYRDTIEPLIFSNEEVCPACILIKLEEELK